MSEKAVTGDCTVKHNRNGVDHPVEYYDNIGNAFVGDGSAEAYAKDIYEEGSEEELGIKYRNFPILK